jgi:hypothetical protein
MRKNQFTFTFLVALAAILVVGGVTALAKGGHATRAHSSAALTVSSADRPLRADDALSQKLVGQLNGFAQRSGVAGVDWGQARQVAPGRWLVDAGANVCLLVGSTTGGASGCGSVSYGVAHGGPMITGQAKGEDPSTTGVVPDGVSAVRVHVTDGVTQTVAVDGNTYAVSHPAPADSLSFDGPQGSITVSLPAAKLP